MPFIMVLYVERMHCLYYCTCTCIRNIPGYFIITAATLCRPTSYSTKQYCNKHNGTEYTEQLHCISLYIQQGFYSFYFYLVLVITFANYMTLYSILIIMKHKVLKRTGYTVMYVEQWSRHSARFQISTHTSLSGPWSKRCFPLKGFRKDEDFTISSQLARL